MSKEYQSTVGLVGPVTSSEVRMFEGSDEVFLNFGEKLIHLGRTFQEIERVYGDNKAFIALKKGSLWTLHFPKGSTMTVKHFVSTRVDDEGERHIYLLVQFGDCTDILVFEIKDGEAFYSCVVPCHYPTTMVGVDRELIVLENISSGPLSKEVYNIFRDEMVTPDKISIVKGYPIKVEYPYIKVPKTEQLYDLYYKNGQKLEENKKISISY